jgi:hypothetical protein
MCGPERSGNCFMLLCVTHAHLGQKLMWKEMKERIIAWKRKICLKLYLLFECLVNEPHPWSQVHHSSKLLGDLYYKRFKGVVVGVGVYHK